MKKNNKRQQRFQARCAYLSANLPRLHQKRLRKKQRLLEAGDVLTSLLRSTHPAKVRRIRLEISRSVVAAKLAARNTAKTLYQVALSSLHLPPKDLPILSTCGPPTDSQQIPTSISNVMNLSLTYPSVTLKRIPSVQFTSVPPTRAHLSSHLLLDRCPWIIPPWIATILSTTPPWLVPPVPNLMFLHSKLSFLLQQPWFIPPWLG